MNLVQENIFAVSQRDTTIQNLRLQLENETKAVQQRESQMLQLQE